RGSPPAGRSDRTRTRRRTRAPPLGARTPGPSRGPRRTSEGPVRASRRPELLEGENGGPDRSRFVPELRRNDADLGAMLGRLHRPPVSDASRPEEVVAGHDRTAPDHDDIRVEDVDEARDTLPQPGPDLPEDPRGELVAVLA